MIFGFFKNKIELICFDLDNTLCDYGNAEVVAEVYIAEKIFSKIRNIKNIKHNSGRNAKNILQLFQEIKNSHLHHDSAPEKYSRKLWIEELFNKLKSENKLVSENNSPRKFNKNTFNKHTSNEKTFNKTTFNKKAFSDLEKDYWDILNKNLKLYDGTIDVLETLKQKYKLVMLTDSDGDKKIKMERIKILAIEKYFDFIITTDDTGVNKPAIENFKQVSELSRVNSKNIISIGDHPDIDLLNAKKIGMKTVWTKQQINTSVHFRFVDHEITDIKQLLVIMNKYSN